jgi:hypothetical protein
MHIPCTGSRACLVMPYTPKNQPSHSRSTQRTANIVSKGFQTVSNVHEPDARLHELSGASEIPFEFEQAFVAGGVQSPAPADLVPFGTRFEGKITSSLGSLRSLHLTKPKTYMKCWCCPIGLLCNCFVPFQRDDADYKNQGAMFRG